MDETKCTRDWAIRNGLDCEASYWLFDVCQAVNDGTLEAGYHTVCGKLVLIREGGSFTS